ncbi:MAG: BTAD domain-containing putative transcriptional regulator [Anaerolineales bacterium]
MSVTVTRTKILLPKPRPDLISRPRLLELLDDVLDYPFTLISAPAGYGKTSLLVDLAHKVEYPVSWLSLDSLDQDLKRFLTHFLASLSLNFPNFGSQTLAVLKNTRSVSINLDQLILALVNDMVENIQEHFVFILDDYHLVEDNQQINQFLSRFGQEMDENCHLILTSRNLFSFPDLALLVGRSMVKGLGLEDLAFNPAEIKSLLKENYQRPISDQEAEILAQDTEGWITGLLLSVEIIADAQSIQSRAAKVSGVDLFDYLAHQVLNQQTPQIQDFLLRTSPLGEFNAEFCKQILGKSPRRTTWSELISEVIQKNLFVQPVIDKSTWLRYHHLFRDFLQHRFRTDFPDEEKKLLYRLVEVYTKNSSWEKAFSAVQDLGDVDAMAKLINDASSSLFHRGRINLLAAWLEILPEEGFEKYPALFALRGISSTLMGKPQLGLSQLHQALKHPRVLSNQYFLAKAYTWRAGTYRLLGKYSNALEDALQAIAHAKTTPSKTIFLAEAERETGLAYQRLGSPQKSKDYLTHSLITYQSINDEKNAALVQMDLGVLNVNLGNLQEANHQYQRALDIWEKLDNVDQQAGLMNNLGVLSHIKGNFIQALDWFFLALQKAVQSSNFRMQAFTYSSLGDLAQDLSLFPTAENYYHKAFRLAETIKEGFLRFYLELCFSTLNLKSNHLQNADKHLRTAYNLIFPNPSRYELGLWRLEHGRLLLAEGKISAAEDDYRLAIKLFKEADKPVELAQSHTAIAIAALESGDTETARNHLIAALKILQPLGTFQPLLSKIYHQKGMLETILNYPNPNPLLLELKNNLLAFLGNLPTFQKAIRLDEDLDQKLTVDLDIQALGRLQVRIKGNKISASEWTHQKTVREIFFYLLSEPRGASKDQIGFLFWPDSSQEQLNRQFKNVVYRLRRAIGRKYILYDSDSRRYFFNRQLDYRYDVDDFLSFIRQVENEDDHKKRIQWFREALALYHHPYAPILDGVWTEPIRMNLYLKYERAALEVAAEDLTRGNNQSCLDICHRLLEIEPGQERAWRLCMQSYANHGDRGGITRSYRQCKKNLSKLLGVQPSLETENLYLELVK